VLKTSIMDPGGPLGNMLEQCPHPVLVHNMAGDLYQFNRAACEVLGYSPQELTVLGSTMALLDMPREVKGHHRRYNHNGHISRPATVRRKDGTRMDVTCFFTFLEQGKGLRIILVLREN
jgi:PAS domain S-box-containing protein